MKTAKTKPPKSVSRFTLHESASASALIIAVILTSLLAIIGVMFVMIARVDKMATSAISENKELNFAVETVVALVSQELVLDVPGVAGAEYYDYPDTNNAWLASLEPYEKTAGNYYWRQISDVTGFLNDKGFSTQDVNVKPVGLSTTVYVREYPELTLDGNGELKEQSADADGDGIADSKWIKLDNITSNKGKPIYAAIRVVDNGGMINVNTARQFDPNSAVEDEIDGSSQTQIDLLALSERSSASDPLGKLDDARFGDEPLPHNLNDYIRNVVWRYNEPNGRYTPFDLSDELELRNRFLLEIESIDTAIETFGWVDVFTGNNYLHTPVDSSSDFDKWCHKAYYDLTEPNSTENYSYRHIATIYNMDRIIDPNGAKMTNINTADVNALYNSICKGLLDANYIDVNIAAQIAVNITDYRDSDSNVTVYPNPDDGKTYYGFEQPCIYISELAHKFTLNPVAPGPTYSFPADYFTSYAIELYKPYSGDNDPCNWQLVIGGVPIPINNWTGNEQFYVIQNQDSNANASLDVNSGTTIQNAVFTFTDGTVIELQRPVPGGSYITVDSVTVPTAGATWLSLDGTAHSIQRDITLPKCIRRLWDPNSLSPSLGGNNTYLVSDSIYIQAHPANKNFTNVGEIGILFRKGAYYIDAADRPDRIGYGTNKTEEEVRLNLADPNFQQLFKYLTVFDPNDPQYGGHPATETRVKGRININTAPWYVIAQLPWVSQRKGEPTNYKLAEAIVAYRDKLDLSSTGGPDYSGQLREPGFRNIGELNRVVSGNDDYRIDYYARDTNDLDTFPDLTASDGAKDDFEERDVIFARISNLVTVRSDVFTAYILVRIGADGPQKRVMAILDRSNVYSGDGKVRVIALHPVPDPR
jgi:hypothetical protein